MKVLFYIIIGILIIIIGLYLYSFLGLNRAFISPQKDAILRNDLWIYHICQYGYYETHNKYATSLGKLDCEFSKNFTVYTSEAEFRNIYPDLCIRMSIGITQDSFTVIGHSNIDGEDLFYYAYKHGVGWSALCPKDSKGNYIK